MTVTLERLDSTTAGGDLAVAASATNVTLIWVHLLVRLQLEQVLTV